MCTSIGLKGEMCQAREFAQRAFKQRHNGQSTLNGLSRLLWMQVLELRLSSHLLVDLRIVLHRTGTKGIEACIHAKVIIREVCIVAHHRQLVTLGQCGILSTLHRSRNLVIAIIVPWQTVALATLLRKFENQRSI